MITEEESYRRMKVRHAVLWKYIEQFIKDSSVESVLEIGCGINSPVSDWVTMYTGVDINKSVDAIHRDFMLMGANEVCKHDMLLACGVIEHCHGYVSFLKQVKAFNYPFTLISFFNGLNRDEETYKIKDKVLVNRYSHRLLKTSLGPQGLRLKHEFINLGPKDDVLIIHGEQEQ